MEQRLIDIIAESEEFQNGDKSWYAPITNEQGALEVLLMSDYNVIDRSSRRWWTDVEVVAEFPTEEKTYYIGWMDAETTGDLTAEERGWEFDPSTIKEYEQVEKVIYSYKPKNDE